MASGWELAKACCEIGFSSFLLVLVLLLVLEVGHSLIPSSRTRNSSGSKRSTNESTLLRFGPIALCQDRFDRSL